MPIRAVDPSRRIPARLSVPTIPLRNEHIRARARTRIVPPDLAEENPATAPARSAPAKRAHHKVDRDGPNWDDDGNYIVGRGRPPQDRQWKKGQSGNPKGPKKQEKLDPADAFEQEVLAPFKTRMNGQEIELNLGNFSLTLMKASAAKGTLRAQQALLDLYTRTLRGMAERESTPEMLDWEQELIDKMMVEYDLPARPVVRQTDRSMDEPGDVS